MKFFKHFTDSHRGQTMAILFDRMEHVGPSCYWTLVEMCAEKLEKGDEELFTDAHCKFRFHERVLRKNLRISRKNLRKFLGICAEISQVFSTFSGEIVEIEFPKLLECLDRDAKRARTDRGLAAPKIKNKIKNKEIDVAYLNWRDAASAVRSSIKRWGNWGDSEAEVREELGDVVFETARRAGVHRLRMVPDDNFAVLAIAGMLKEANNQLQLREAT
jgi:hypothetical protein